MATVSGPPADLEPGLGPRTLGGLLWDVTRRHPAREALCWDPPGGTTVRWSYRTLAARADQYARALVAAGVEPGERVALLMGNRPEWVAAAFGVALAGCVLVPVNTLFEPPEIAYVLRHSGATTLLYQPRLAGHAYDEQVAHLAPSLPGLARRLCLGSSEHASFLRRGRSVPPRSVAARAERVTALDDAVVIYTSGTTGQPKGVLHCHRAAAIQSWRFARLLRLDPTVRVWSAFPFFWTAGFCMVMGATLAAGGCLVLQERFEPAEALALLERERVTTPHAWPHQAAALEAHPDWLRRDLSSIRHADPLGAFARHPSVAAGSGWSPRAAYGLTETFTIVSAVAADAPAAARDGHEGFVLPGNVVRIVDPDTETELPPGATGEIRVRGPTLMKGYVGVDPAEVFDGAGFFPTGDAGWVDRAGRLHWAGRADGLVKTGGANVSPVELETALLAHPGLRTAAVVGVPDPLLGQLVVVCAVAQPGATVTEHDVRAFLQGKLASYKLPRRVLFFDERELSFTGSAKVRTNRLRQLATARLRPAPPGGGPGPRLA